MGIAGAAGAAAAQVEAADIVGGTDTQLSRTPTTRRVAGKPVQGGAVETAAAGVDVATPTVKACADPAACEWSGGYVVQAIDVRADVGVGAKAVDGWMTSEAGKRHKIVELRGNVSSGLISTRRA